MAIKPDPRAQNCNTLLQCSSSSSIQQHDRWPQGQHSDRNSGRICTIHGGKASTS